MKMENDRNYFERGRQPQNFLLMTFFENGRQSHFVGKRKTTIFSRNNYKTFKIKTIVVAQSRVT
jgi:hypothetical protein